MKNSIVEKEERSKQSWLTSGRESSRLQKTPGRAREAAVKLYAVGGGLTAVRQNHLLLANTNNDIRWLNHLTQYERRLKTGLLKGEPLRVLGPSESNVNRLLRLATECCSSKISCSVRRSDKERLPERILRAAVDPLRRVLAEQLPGLGTDVRWANGQSTGQKRAVCDGLGSSGPALGRMLVELDAGERVVVSVSDYPHLCGSGYATLGLQGAIEHGRPRVRTHGRSDD